jgi:hypothetical protein
MWAMNAHIINCSEEDFEEFVKNGYIGVGIVCTGTTSHQLSKVCKTSYSMYADMKSVRPGDLIFIHAKNKIYGIFEAVSEFKEEPKVPAQFLSENMYYASPFKPQTGWKYTGKELLPEVGKYRRVAIKHHEMKGVNVCFQEGFESTEVFELKRKNKVWSIPERWQYTDTARTVRPLMLSEAAELFNLLLRENSDIPTRRIVTPSYLPNYRDIKFILNPKISNNEKIIEGWVLSEIGRNLVLDKAIGPLTCFGNNIPIGYLKFADIIGYQDLGEGLRKYKVIEVKKDESLFPDNVNQLLNYVTWLSENITHDSKLILGVIIAKDFSPDCIAFVNDFNSVMIGQKIRLIKYSYMPPDYGSLCLEQVA